MLSSTRNKLTGCSYFVIRYIRNHIPLEELELRARYPPVDSMGQERPRGQAKGAAGSSNQ